MGAGFRSIAPLGASVPRVVTQAGFRGVLAFWIGGAGGAAVVTPPVEVPVGAGRLPARRSREYEDYLQALREGREYTLPDAEPRRPPKTRRKGKRREPQLAAFPAYTGQWLGDLAAQPGVSAAIDLAAYRDYRAAYEAAARAFLAAELARLEAARRRDEEEALLVLLLAA